MKLNKVLTTAAISAALIAGTGSAAFASTTSPAPTTAGSTSNVKNTIQAGSSGTFSYDYMASGGSASYAGSVSATSVPSGWSVTSPAFGATRFSSSWSGGSVTVAVPWDWPGTYSVSIKGVFTGVYATGYGAPERSPTP